MQQGPVKNAMTALRKKEKPLQKCCDLLTKTLHSNLNKNGDFAAQFCLFMNACRSLTLHEEVQFATELYTEVQENFPKEGLPSLFKQGDSLEQHFALLQLFGILVHDGETICYTLDDFEPALQFIVKGESKSFTLLVPLQIEKALTTILDNCEPKLLERYFAFFFPNKNAPFCNKPLKLEIPQELLKQVSRSDLIRLYHYLAIGFTDHLDTDLLDLDEPTPHQLVIVENYLKRFSQAISFAPLYEKGWDFDGYIKTLFLSNNPAISDKAFEIWSRKSSDPDFTPRTQKLTQSIPNSRWRIKLFKLAPSDNFTPSFFPYFKQREGLNALSHFIEWISDHPEFTTNEIDNLAGLYLEKFGLTELAYKLLEKVKGAKIAPAFQQAAKRLTAPKELKKALEVGRDRSFFNPKEEALSLFRIIPLFLKSDKKEALKLLQELNQEHLDKRQKQEVKKWTEELKQTPSLRHALILSDIDRAAKKNDWPTAHTLLSNVMSQNPDNKNEVKARLLKLPSLPQTLLVHPQISDYLPAEKLVEELLKLKLVEQTLPFFPLESEALNREVITQVLEKKLKIDSQKIFTYLLKLKDKALLEKWISNYPPQSLSQNEIKTLLELNSKTLSPYLRKHAITETLRTLKNVYTSYIPTTSAEEQSAWITLILEKEVADFFPVLHWMEETAPTLELLTLFSTSQFNSKERKRVIDLLTKHPICKADLEALLPLYTQFKLLTPPVISTFVKEAAQAKSREIKLKVWEVFQASSDKSDLETWMSAVKLLTQTKSKEIFKYIRKEAPFPQETSLAKAIANAATLQISDPSKEVETLEQISTFHDRHNLTEDTPILSLYARSGHPPLLVKVLNQFTKWKLKKQKEQLPLLESVTKNIPQQHGAPDVDQALKNLISSVEIENFSTNNLIFLIDILTHYPKNYTLHPALKILHHLLEKNVRINNFNPKCLKLALQKSDITLHAGVATILDHPFLPKMLKEKEIYNIKLDLIEHKLQFYIQEPNRSALLEPIEYFLKDSEKIDDPEKEKKLFLLALEALLVAPSTTELPLNLLGYINRLFTKMTRGNLGLSRQAYAFLQLQKVLPIKVEFQSYPSRPKDFFYKYFTSLVAKSLTSNFMTQEKYQDYYDFLLNHLLNLILSYPENVEELTPYCHQYALLQLPSGHDLTQKAVENKFTLLSLLLQKSLLTPDKDLSHVLEMAFYVAGKVTLVAVPIPQQKAAHIKAMNHLVHHPSIYGITRALSIYMENKDLREDGETFQAFWDEISKAIQEKKHEQVSSVSFINSYGFVLLDLVKDHKDLAKKLFREFCDKIQTVDASKESLSLLSNFKFSSLNR